MNRYIARTIRAVWFTAILGLCAGAYAESVEDGKTALRAKDFEKATKIITPLAEAGDAEAQLLLGYIFLKGWGTGASPESGLPWFEKSAAQGNANAQLVVGKYHYFGNSGVPKNLEKAEAFFLKAANQESTEAQYTLGELYFDAKKYPDSFKWYKQAAEQGHTDAQYHVGSMYMLGDGTTKNIDETKKWWEKAAAKGHPGAKMMLQQYLNAKQK